MAFAALGEGDKAAELFSMLNPINHARTRAGRAALQGRALCRRRRRLCGARRTSDAAAGPGTPARRAGCSAPASRAFSACACAASSCISTPAFPSLAELRDDVRRKSSRYEIVVENPDGVAVACASPKSTASKSRSGRCDCQLSTTALNIVFGEDWAEAHGRRAGSKRDRKSDTLGFRPRPPTTLRNRNFCYPLLNRVARPLPRLDVRH